MANKSIWRSEKEIEGMDARKRAIAVHGREYKTFSIGYKHEFQSLNFDVVAWCYEKDLIESACEAVAE